MASLYSIDWKLEIEGNVLEQIRMIAMKIDRGVVVRTPVDTGRLRANWQVGLNAAPKGVIDDVDPGGGATIAKGLQVVSGINDTTETIHIVNNLVYAVPIENGHGVNNNPGVMVAATLATLGLS